MSETVGVVINCDGYEPTCSECGCVLEDTDTECPICEKPIDWIDKR